MAMVNRTAEKDEKKKKSARCQSQRAFIFDISQCNFEVCGKFLDPLTKKNPLKKSPNHFVSRSSELNR
jgi:hypothetical protein